MGSIRVNPGLTLEDSQRPVRSYPFLQLHHDARKQECRTRGVSRAPAWDPIRYVVLRDRPDLGDEPGSHPQRTLLAEERGDCGRPPRERTLARSAAEFVCDGTAGGQQP